MSQSKKSKLAVIRNYFGTHPGQGLREFTEELKALSSEEKVELAQGAAVNMGLTQDEVDFDLA